MFEARFCTSPCSNRRRPTGRRVGVASYGFLGILLGAFFVPPGAADAQVETPAIDLEVTRQAGSILLEWDHPADEFSRALTTVDSIWGGTARVGIRGIFSGTCDVDINIRSQSRVDTFRPPFVEEPDFNILNPDAINYWSGSAIPRSGGSPDICSNLRFTISVDSTDVQDSLLTITADGTGDEIELSWASAGADGSSGTITIPPTFRANVDSLSLVSGVNITFDPGSVVPGEVFLVSAISVDASFTWDYVLHGGDESDFTSSSDSGRSILTFCEPGEWVPFDFGLEFSFFADKFDTTIIVLDTMLMIDTLVTPPDTTLEISERDSMTTVTHGFIPSGSDTVGVLSFLYRHIDGYRIYRSDITNPDRFTVLREFSFCDSADVVDYLSGDKVTYLDDEGIHDGFPYNYYVTAFDTLTGQESPIEDLETRVFARSDATDDLDRILVVPNPYKRRAAWDEGDERIQFRNLPERAYIRIYTVASDLIREWEHGGDGGTSEWDLRNGDGESVSSGVYVYHVESLVQPGNDKLGKFIIVR